MSTPAQIRSYSPGQYLFREGDPSQALFLIKKGTLAIRKAKSGGFIELARVYANEVVGELSFFDRQPRSASAVAVTPVEVLEISFDSLDKIYKGVPDYLKTIMASVAERLRKADETIRRLQKNVQEHTDEPAPVDDEPTAADVLAATSDIDMPSLDETEDSGDAPKS